MIKRLLILLFIFYSCSSDNNSSTIIGNIDNKSKTKIFLIEADSNNQPIIVDSTNAIDGSFNFKREVFIPNINFIQVKDYTGNFPFVLEKGTIEIELYKDSIPSSTSYGTKSNDSFMEYKTKTKAYIKTLNSIQKEMQEASFKKDTLLYLDLQEEINGISDQIKNYELEFIKLNNDSYISVLILERFLNSKLISQDSAKTHYKNFTKRVVNSPSGININQILKAPKEPAKVGEIAPNFNGPKPNGDLFYLDENLKKITLIDFWASWCKPCRVANPGLVSMYNKYKSKGLQIISVSLDRDKNQWLQAINDDGLYWDAHVSNLMFWKDPIAVLYKVNAIPATFLLDENGKIIEKNLRGIQLENKISQLLN